MQSTQEIWKDIPGFEGFYQASNLGRIKSLEREYRTGEHYHTLKTKERVLCEGTDKDGYKKVALSVNKIYYRRVHRLVALTFLPGFPSDYTVNHKNGIKNDNRVENLEWMTVGDNHKHAYQVLGRKPPGTAFRKLFGCPHLRKKIIQMDMQGNEIRVHESLSAAARELNAGTSEISKVARGIGRSCKGFKWKYA